MGESGGMDHGDKSNTSECPVGITEKALDIVGKSLTIEDDSSQFGLCIEVMEPLNSIDYGYDLYFVDLKEVDMEDGKSFPLRDNISLFLRNDDIGRLKGATLETRKMEGGEDQLIIKNPNRPHIANDTTLNLEGTIEEKVLEVLQKRVNPAIAAHGGFADLLKVENNVVYIKLGGGCQGCGMADVTITANIERMLRELIPEIYEVVDATNHEMGANPFFS